MMCEGSLSSASSMSLFAQTFVIHVGFIRCLVKCCVMKNAEWDLTVSCLQTTPATSIREVTSLYLIRMTIRLFSGQLLNVLAAYRSGRRCGLQTGLLFRRLWSQRLWFSSFGCIENAVSNKPEKFPSERRFLKPSHEQRFLTPSHSDMPVTPFPIQREARICLTDVPRLYSVPILGHRLSLVHGKEITQ